MQSTHQNDLVKDLKKTSLITIKVGKELRTFAVLQEKLCKESIYFQVALDGRYLEATTHVIILDDVPSETFEAFVEFVNAGELEVPQILGLTKFEVLVELYVLGDRFDAQRFRIAVCDGLYRECGSVADLPLCSMANALDIIPSNLPIRKMFVYKIALRFYNDDLDIVEDIFPTAFYNEVEAMTSLMRDKPYGLCQQCWEEVKDDDEIDEWALDTCDHFFDEVSGWSILFYRE